MTEQNRVAGDQELCGLRVSVPVEKMKDRLSTIDESTEWIPIIGVEQDCCVTGQRQYYSFKMYELIV